MKLRLLYIVFLFLLVGCNQVRQLRTEFSLNTPTPESKSEGHVTISPSPAQPNKVTPIPTLLPSTTATASSIPPSEEIPTEWPSPSSTFPPPTQTSEAPWKSLLDNDGSYYWALVGDSTSFLNAEQEAGIEAKVFSLSWRLYEPSSGFNQNYIARKRAEYQQIRNAGMEVILSLGYHDPPDWIHRTYVNSHYINQHGVPYVSQDPIDGGDLNLVWNRELRSLVERYTAHVFDNLGTDFVAVRIGGGRFGELSYPPAEYEGQNNAYWAFDANAQPQNPVPDWRPGDPFSNDEPARFLDWYLDALVEFQNWQIDNIRTSYGGPLMILYPSWGLRPGDIELALATGLDGSSPPELNGEVQRGYDFARQVAALTDPNLILTTTWLDADIYPDLEPGEDPRFWSPIRYLAFLANEHPLQLALYGENTGQGSAQDMALSAQRMKQYGLLGMAWYRESELFLPEYASLEDYQRIIQDTDNGESSIE